MSYFVVTYDLRKKNKEEYPALYEELKRLGGHRYQESCWFLDTAAAPTKVWQV